MNERNRTKFTVLGMLALQDLSGYEIIKLIQTSTEHFWSESVGQIYPALAQCVTEGLALCHDELASKSTRGKKIYSITPAGRKVLTEWLKKTPKNASVRNELLLKLFFGHNTDTKDTIYHVRHRQKEIESTLVSYEAMKKELIDIHHDSPHLNYWLITLNYGITLSEAELSWCVNTLKSLENEV